MPHLERNLLDSHLTQEERDYFNLEEYRKTEGFEEEDTSDCWVDKEEWNDGYLDEQNDPIRDTVSDTEFFGDYPK